MPQPYRDPHSQALIFVPTREEKEISVLKDELNQKSEYVDELIKKLEDKLKES